MAVGRSGVQSSFDETVWENLFNEKLCINLLQMARRAIQDFLMNCPLQPPSIELPGSIQFGGVFVTLWMPVSGGNELALISEEALRGCVGRVGSHLSLLDSIQESAVNAAIKDPRFPPLSLHELEKIRLEISILSPFQKVLALEGIKIGKHGLMIDGGIKRGLLLPKVAQRMNWDKQSFLNGVCEKAGLSRNCWPKEAELFAFTAFSIEE